MAAPPVDGAVPIGRYAKLRLGSLQLGADKREINPLVLSVFGAADRRPRRLPVGDPEAARYGDRAGRIGGEGAEAAEPGPAGADIVEYAASVAVVRDRLEVAGFTLAATYRAFNAAVRTAVRERATSPGAVGDPRPRDFVDADAGVPADLTPAAWLDGLRQIRALGLRPTRRDDPALIDLPPLARYMLAQPVDGWYGLPTPEVRHAIRLAVEVCPDDEVVYDLTDLLRGGEYDTADDLLAHADHLLSADVIAERRVVVLTKGAADRAILERSLRLLYPHLAAYFRFMNLDGTGVTGGAGALASVVAAFAGAGILNRVVALFANDTAGRGALRTLEPIRLPPNVVALPYPRLALAAAYPAIGPSGTVVMDVNGLAAGLELYLGTDVLTDGGALTPVQWRGFDEELRAYQGEIMAKRAVRDRYDSKLAVCEAAPERLSGYDWDGMRLVLDQLRGAFHHLDEQEIVAAETP